MEEKVIAVKALNLPVKYEGRVQLCFDAVEKLIPGAEIYLYGSYALNQVTAESTVKILVLIGDSFSAREMKTLGWEVEDLICRVSDETFSFDIKVLTPSLYKTYVYNSQSVREIDSTKKNLREIRWIDK